MKTFLAWSNGFMMGAMAVLIAQKIDQESKNQQTSSMEPMRKDTP